MGLSFDEWEEAGREILNPTKVAELGYRAFRAYWGPQQRGWDDTWTKAAITGFAMLIDAAFVHMPIRVRRQLRKNMLWKGRFFEPALWEDSRYAALGHVIVEQNVSRGVRPTILELLLMAHDLEAYIRPNLLRLLWVSRISNGATVGYERAMLNRFGEPGSIGYALDELRIWFRTPAAGILKSQGKKALRRLVLSFKSTARDQVSLDELRNIVDHRDFLLDKDRVTLRFHRARGVWKPRRIELTVEQVTEMRQQLLGLIPLMKAFEVMFRRHESTPARRRRPIRP